MNVRPAVTVVVPFLNAEATIGALVRGLESQVPSSLGETEFIFVDNGSTDGGRQIAESSSLTHARIADQSKPGVSAVRNRGLELAQGDVLAVIDSDCVPSRQWLRELVEPFANPDVLLAAGGLASYPPRTPAQRFAAQYGVNDATRTLEMAVIPFANGRNMAVRRSAAEAVGGWPEDMLRGDDIEFSQRVVSHFGCSIEYRPLALVFHQDRASDEDLFRQAHGYGRGIAMLYERHPEQLRWGWPQRLRRVRMSSRRRVGDLRARLGQGVRRGDSDRAEFAHYLALWDRWFWRGFFDERQALRRDAK